MRLDEAPLCLGFEEDFCGEGEWWEVMKGGGVWERNHPRPLSLRSRPLRLRQRRIRNNDFLFKQQLPPKRPLYIVGVGYVNGTTYNATDCIFNLTSPNGEQRGRTAMSTSSSPPLTPICFSFYPPFTVLHLQPHSIRGYPPRILSSLSPCENGDDVIPSRRGWRYVVDTFAMVEISFSVIFARTAYSPSWIGWPSDCLLLGFFAGSQGRGTDEGARARPRGARAVVLGAARQCTGSLSSPAAPANSCAS
ncbi:hypothetical protein B0H16DRAFT_977761 [Mycena metata]|uniref:Uncharacterized protein n=1 Tax=Mycena metata TaxID=1033252 RepID=A0AAD7IKT6_9AGAR|nr:hypothetical protein B0H16DRAFT_977761 [Mycena metata]